MTCGPQRAPWRRTARWAADVLLRVGRRWPLGRAVSNPARRPPSRAMRRGPEAGRYCRGMVNAHSHAFQRAFVGPGRAGATAATTTSGAGATACTAWRYRITPEQLEAHRGACCTPSCWQAGYTQVCEFHYLHHARGRQRPYADDSLAMALAAGARSEHRHRPDAAAGALRARASAQRACATTSGASPPPMRRWVRRACERIGAAGCRWSTPAWPCIRCGRWPRCAAGMRALQRRALGDAGIHIHVAEQTAGSRRLPRRRPAQRPIEWLCATMPAGCALAAGARARTAPRDEIDARAPRAAPAW